MGKNPEESCCYRVGYVYMKMLLSVVVVLWLVVALGAAPPLESVVLEAVEDAYLVTDNAAPDDPEGLRDTNYGSLDFVRAWYVWKVLGEEQVVSIGLFKFDLGPIRDKAVSSAHLQLLATGANLDQAVRLVDVHLVEGQWSEGEVTFNTRPPWGVTPIATGAVYGDGVWYSWDVTGSVVSQQDKGEVSYSLGLRTLEEGKEEVVVFAARESGRNIPRLLVTFTIEPSGIAWWVWAASIGGAAVLAFVIGWWLSRRRPSSPSTPREPAQPIPSR